jgi:hypothetical protein
LIKAFVKIVLAAGWLGSMAWLVRHEAFPEFFAREMSGYRSLVMGRAEIRDSWMRILFNGQPIGYSHTSIELSDESKEPEMVLQNSTVVQINLLGQNQRFKVSTKAVLDGSYGMKEFSLSMLGAGQSVAAQGRRVKGENYEVELDLAGTVRKTNLTIPKDTVLFSPHLEMTMRSLKPGEETIMNVMDPLSMTRKKVRFIGEARETLTAMGREVPCTRIGIIMDDVRLQTWVDADGRVVRQTTPFGWIMESCTVEEALAIVRVRSDAIPSTTIKALLAPLEKLP